MKRLCFDTESDSPLLPGVGNWTPEDVRHHIYHYSAGNPRSVPIEMKCAAVYDLDLNALHEFRMNNTDEKAALIKLLLQADQLISHSGWTVDLTIIEETYGLKATAPLRKIPHHDLYDPTNVACLSDLSKKYLSVDLNEAVEAELVARIAEANLRWPEFRPGMRDNAWYYDLKLAKAVRDVKLTTAVYFVVKDTLR